MPVGHTPLMLACARGALEPLITLVLEAKAEVDARTASGRTALMVPGILSVYEKRRSVKR